MEGVRREGAGAEFSQDLTGALECPVSSCHSHKLPPGTGSLIQAESYCDGLSDRYVQEEALALAANSI